MLFIAPLWFMRAGSRFGVHFFESAVWIESMVDVVEGCFAVFEDCTLGVVRCDGLN